MRTKRLTGVLFCSVLLSGCSVEPLQESPVSLTEISAAETTAASSTIAQISGKTEETTAQAGSAGLLHAPEDICLTDTDGQERHYTFVYDGETFCADYSPDHWKITDSYKITVSGDILIICTALKNTHPVHGADMISEREASDMAYEWAQHNLTYQFLPDDSEYKAHAKDVDLDPYDVGKSFFEIYEDRTGKKFSLGDVL